MLLSEIRSIEVLKEKSIGCFYLKGKGVLHFHIQKGRRFAHVFNGKEWSEVDLAEGLSAAKQKDFFRSIRKLVGLKAK